MADSDQEVHFAYIKKQVYEMISYDSDIGRLTQRIQSRNVSKSENPADVEPQKSFRSVLRDFRNSIGGFRRAGSVYPAMWSVIGSELVEINLIQKIKSIGSRRQDIDEATVFSVPSMHAGQLMSSLDEHAEFMSFHTHLPEILVVGVVSIYDGYISELLQLALRHRPSIIEESDKKLSYRQIMSFGSLEAAQRHIVGKELDTILYGSRQDQIDWISTKLRLNINLSDPKLKEFSEVCERRNILTHNGGRVSEQYIDNCRKSGISPASANIGEKIRITDPYIRSAVDTVYEVGVRLGVIVWRCVAEDEAELAETELHNAGYALIKQGRYALAERILEFAVTMPKLRSEPIKRMNIVNLANAKRRLGKDKECDSLLDQHDWRASSLDFQISVAAVRKDISEVVRLMRRIGRTDQIPADAYNDWPVFANVRDDETFRSTFAEVFGMSFDRYNIDIKSSPRKPEELPRAADAEASD